MKICFIVIIYALFVVKTYFDCTLHNVVTVLFTRFISYGRVTGKVLQVHIDSIHEMYLWNDELLLPVTY